MSQSTATIPHALPRDTGAPVPVAIAAGDGIGPEITTATLRILEAAGAGIRAIPVEVGGAAYARGVTSGIDAAAWDAIEGTRVLLKGPITTPQGGGWKSVNVTLRKTLGLYANLRPCAAYHPFVPTPHPGMDVVVIRENEEDLYAGIEHQQTDETVQCLKLVTRSGCERIVRYAFAYARAHGRKKVTCVTKDNIMKLTDGLFHQVFDAVATEHPDIVSEHRIVDIAAARLAARPTDYDVIVTLNLYGDILSDIAAEVAGSVGLAPSANLGRDAAMFEAIHGSAPDIAGMGIANPSGMLLAAVQMLVHIGKPRAAELIHNAWLATIEDGIHTRDLVRAGATAKVVGTVAFADAVIERLGRVPATLPEAAYGGHPPIVLPEAAPVPTAPMVLTGVDAFLHHPASGTEALGHRLAALAGDRFGLQMITNRGVKVWPGGRPGTRLADHWRCRFTATGPVAVADVLALLGRIDGAGLRLIKTEHLYTRDGKPAYSLGQGQ